jgi:hypothetical protein
MLLDFSMFAQQLRSVVKLLHIFFHCWLKNLKYRKSAFGQITFGSLHGELLQLIFGLFRLRGVSDSMQRTLKVTFSC